MQANELRVDEQQHMYDVATLRHHMAARHSTMQMLPGQALAELGTEVADPMRVLSNWQP